LNQRRDYVSLNNPISYSDIPERNIFDTRFTGCGKTTSALNYIVEVVKANWPVIVLMQSYERVENNYLLPLLKLDVSLKERTIIFKGKTQDDMCKFSPQYTALYEKGKTPKNECKTCSDKERCAYQKQTILLKGYVDSKRGFCILTTDKSLNKILLEMGSLNPTIIIDDISLSTVLMPDIINKISFLRSLLEYNISNDVSALIINELLKKIVTFKKGSDKKIIQYISSNNSRLQSELEQFKISASSGEGLSDSPSYAFVIQLISWVRNECPLHFYLEYGKLKIVADVTSKYSNNRIFYLNATPSLKDKYCVKQLGKFKPLEGDVKGSKRYHIFQIIDSANSKRAIVKPRKIIRDFNAISGIFKDALSFTDQKLLLFTFEDAFSPWVTSGILSDLPHSAECYFGSGTRGTNDYKDYPISMIVGNPCYPNDYYLHPAFEEVWIDNDVFEKKKEDDPYAYRVDGNISKQEARVNLLQMIGRNLRDSSDNPNAVKVVVVFSNIDIEEGCKKQNGGSVFPIHHIRPEMQIIQSDKKGKKDETPFFDTLKRSCQAALKPKIAMKIEEHIDQMLKENPDVPYPLDVAASELQKRIVIYGVQNIKDIITPLYELEINHDIMKRGKKIPTAFIIRKTAKLLSDPL
jgi:hypothetical protein